MFTIRGLNFISLKTIYLWLQLYLKYFLSWLKLNSNIIFYPWLKSKTILYTWLEWRWKRILYPWLELSFKIYSIHDSNRVQNSLYPRLELSLKYFLSMTQIKLNMLDYYKVVDSSKINTGPRMP